MLGELARWINDDDSARSQNDLAVIYQELDAATAASIASAGTPPSDQVVWDQNSSTTDASRPPIEWLVDWLEGGDQAGALPVADGTQRPAPAPSAATEEAAEAQADLDAKRIAVETDSERKQTSRAPLTVPSNTPYDTDVPTNQQARAPPVRGPPGDGDTNSNNQLRSFPVTSQ